MQAPALAAMLLLIPLPLAAESLVAARNLPAQTVLAPGDVLLVDAEIPGASGPLEAVIGLQTRTAIPAGRPILAANVAPPALVQRNAVVTLVYSAGVLTIEAEGRALASGTEGETIRALNLSSKATVSGTVDTAGRLRVREAP